MSSRSDDTTRDASEQRSSERRAILGSIRRAPIKVTSKAFWQARGVLLQDGVTYETIQAEVFSGIGWYARPKAGRNAEAIIAYVGTEAQNPVMIAQRDEDTRKQVAQIDEDEGIAFNTIAGMRILKDGTVEVRMHDGTARKLAFADEVNNLRAFTVQQFSGAGHVHTVSGAATTAVTAVTAPVPAPATAYPGTVVLKGQ